MIQSLPTPLYQKESWKQSEDIIPSRPRVIDLGNVDYLYGYKYQKKVLDGVIRNIFPDTLIFCQHPHTFTTSHLAKDKNLLISKKQLQSEKIVFFVTDRGGDITYHGPGQLVIYPIFDLKRHRKDLRFFLSSLEEVVIDFLKEFEIIAERRLGYTGVWIDDEKIASIGIGVKKWVSFHGLAINLNTDLRFFSMIKPCGLDVKMTSLGKIFGKKIDIVLVKKTVLQKFIKIFYTENNYLKN